MKGLLGRVAVIFVASFAGVGSLAFAPAGFAQDTLPDEIVLREALVIERVGEYGRSAVHTDAIEALVVAGRWLAPQAGDSVALPDWTVRTWETASADEDGKVVTLYGRVRWLPEIHARNRNLRENAQRMAINARIQGTAADLLKKAMITLDAELRQKHPTSKLLMTVHDELVLEVHKTGRLPVVNFAAGGVATPADAALMMQLGADGVFVGSGIFKSSDPEVRARAVVKATTHYQDPQVIAEVSKGLGLAMPGLEIKSIPEKELLAPRGW